MIKLSDIEGDDPFQIFTLWYDQAKHSDVDDPTVMHLATCVKSRPSGRIVLLKRFCAEKGFVFFTNYASRKGHEISLNPRVALTFIGTK